MKNKNNDFGVLLKSTLKKRAESLDLTEADSWKATLRITNRIEEETEMKEMKRSYKIGRALPVALAICAISGVTVFGAARAVMWVGSSSSADEFSYEQLAQQEEEAGFDIKAPQSFSNGYSFSKGVPVSNSSLDADGNTTAESSSLELIYSKDGSPDIDLMAGDAEFFGSDSGSHADITFTYKGAEDASFSDGNGSADADKTAVLSGITLYYSSLENLFVPEDYEPTDEELALEEAGELNISYSYGADEISRSTSYGISWTDSGIHYYLFGFDIDLSSEDLFNMAKEVIDSEQ